MGVDILEVDLHAINHYTLSLVVGFGETNIGKIDIACGGGDGKSVQEKLQ